MQVRAKRIQLRRARRLSGSQEILLGLADVIAFKRRETQHFVGVVDRVAISPVFGQFAGQIEIFLGQFRGLLRVAAIQRLARKLPKGVESGFQRPFAHVQQPGGLRLGIQQLENLRRPLTQLLSGFDFGQLGGQLHDHEIGVLGDRRQIDGHQPHRRRGRMAIERGLRRLSVRRESRHDGVLAFKSKGLALDDLPGRVQSDRVLHVDDAAVDLQSLPHAAFVAVGPDLLRKVAPLAALPFVSHQQQECGLRRLVEGLHRGPSQSRLLGRDVEVHAA